ncbi:MAG: gluconokinase [Thermoplasmata archaeon]|nr:MAG: gluconokinase [Thermoplasmata archaeon]
MEAMINDLLKPSAFPEAPEKVTMVQTHISVVFIGDEFVYKIKKPVDFGFVNYSTLALREEYCRKEVELNNRFSKGVYLGVYPVAFDGNIHTIDGKGEVVDYAVKMKRLEDKDLMKFRFADKKISTEDISRIAKSIAQFHKSAPRTNEIDDFGKMKVMKFTTDENFEQTAEFIGDSITKEQYDALKNWTGNFYKNNEELFNERIKAGKIRDCHGDLHMEHICLTDPIIIFDCIEFNERFRYIDIASDLSFLLMDLEYNGGDDFAAQLCNDYLKYAGEQDISELIKFFKVYRAYVRGKVTSFMLKDKDVEEDKKNTARTTAQRYFALAHSYILKD